MNGNMKIANMLADNINGFVKLVYESERKKSPFIVHLDKLYQLRLFVEEYKFQLTAEELHRINQFCWNEQYTYWLVDDFRKGLDVIEEYVQRNKEDLFLFSGRIYTLRNLCLLLRKKGA